MSLIPVSFFRTWAFIVGKIDPWLSEFKELIDLSVTLFGGKHESGSRIAVVLLDNCVEFMYKAYLRIVKQVVGTKKKHRITPNEWESETSRRFDKLAKAIETHSKLPKDLIDDSLLYHSIRNELYHTDTPMKTSDKVFREQLNLVLEILDGLFEIDYSQSRIATLTITEKHPILKAAISQVDLLEEDFVLEIKNAKRMNKHYWRRVSGVWKIHSDIEAPMRIMLSLLRSYPECKNTMDISIEAGISISYISNIISGKRGEHVEYFEKCESGFRLSDAGIYYFIKEVRIQKIMYPDRNS